MTGYQIHQGNALDVLRTLPNESAQMCATSPPYWSLRDYKVEGQLGLEETPDEYASALADVFDEVKRVLKPNGTLWLNLGDSYLSAKSDYMPTQAIANGNDRDGITQDSGIGYPPNRRSIRGIKQKDMVGIPWLVAFELRRRGWWLRQDIIWHKPNPMPESVKDRCTKSHEYIFLLSKSQRYYFDYEAIQEPANYDGRKDTIFKGGVKYDDQPIVPGTSANTFHTQGRERWQMKTRERLDDLALVGHRNGESGGIHSGKPFVSQHKHLAEKGQQPNSFHESRAEGIPDEMYAVRNKRDVWSVNLKPFADSHFATFPEKLVEPMILAGSAVGDTVLDPFNGAATTGLVAMQNGRNYVGIELNPDYIEISKRRLSAIQNKLF